VKPDSCIFFMLNKANQLGIRFLAQKVAELNITPVQALILGFLNDEDEISSRELGRRTELDSATMTGIIDRLEAAELIERRGNPADRRSIKVHLTEQGRALAGEAVRVITEANQKFLGVLSQNEQGELRNLIRKLRDQTGRG